MKVPEFMGQTSRARRCVLILQDSTAFWLNIIDDQVKDHFSASICDKPDSPVYLPSWLDDAQRTKPLYVELVLDTSLDEIDRVSVAKTGHKLIDRYRRFTTLRRLRKDYKTASVYSLPSGYDEQIAGVMHLAQPVCWGPWLLKIQRHDVVFHQVCTSTQLFARWSVRFSGRTLVVIQTNEYQRHLLVEKGVAVFLRTLPLSALTVSKNILDADTTRAALEQSMEYLGSVVKFDTSDIRIVGISTYHAECLSSLVASHVPDQQSDATTTLTEKPALDALLEIIVGIAPAYESAFWRNVSMHSVPELAGKHGPDFSAFWVRGYEMCRSVWWSGTRVSSRGQLSDWPLLGSCAQCIQALEPSVQTMLSSRHATIILKSSLILAFIAVIALSLALVQGVRNTRTAHHQLAHIDRLESSISSVQVTSMSRYEAPGSSAVSLFLSDRLISLASYKPQTVLGDIATAVTAVPGIVLDKMVWAVLESDESYASLSYALASVGHRQSLESQDGGDTLQLEVLGRASGKSLAERKLKLDRFVAQLMTLPGPLEIQVIQSPADAALSSNVLNQSQEVFRLLLKRLER